MKCENQTRLHVIVKKKKKNRGGLRAKVSGDRSDSSCNVAEGDIRWRKLRGRKVNRCKMER